MGRVRGTPLNIRELLELLNGGVSRKEARNSFFGLRVYLLKSKFRVEDKLRFP